MNESPRPQEFDAIVVGSGAAGATAALTLATSGLRVLILEKSDRLGGTSAMSGAATWIPGSHVARAAGIHEGREDMLAYFRATAPEGWQQTQDALWQAFVDNAPAMLEFVENHSPLRFTLVDEPDPMTEAPGGRRFGRMHEPAIISRRRLGPLAGRLRRSTMPHIFTYTELMSLKPYSNPVGLAFRKGAVLLKRWLKQEVGQGSALMTGLLSGCLEAGCEIRCGARVNRLVKDDAGRVVGVEFHEGGRLRTATARGGVVIATGGFEWNAAMRQKHFPGPFDRCGSPPTNEGDGQRMAAEAGAALAHMDQANVVATVPTVYEGRPHGLPSSFHLHPGAIVVNPEGKRFASEFDYNLGYHLDRRDANGAPLNLPAWVIADSSFMRRAWAFRWYASYEPGWLRKAPSIAALAAEIGLDGDALAATVDRYNRFADQGRDEDFRRGESIWEQYKAGSGSVGRNAALERIDRAPFYAFPINRSFVGTKGGAAIDAGGHVLDRNGVPIPGLFCAGNAMANPIGTLAIGSGSTIGPCMTWGHICALSIIAASRRSLMAA